MFLEWRGVMSLSYESLVGEVGFLCDVTGVILLTGTAGVVDCHFHLDFHFRKLVLHRF